MMAWTFRGVCVVGLIIFAIQRNWAALCWVIVALIQHERAQETL